VPGVAARIGRRITAAKERSGLGGIAREAAHLLRRAAVLPLVLAVERVFDWRMGVRTRGLLLHEAALAPLSIGGDPVRYEPVDLLPWRRLHATMPIARSSATFVDLGAGRGRAVVLAAEMGFRRVVGVELDAQLVQEARENIRRWRSRRTPRRPGQEVVIVQGDAARYRPPGGPLVIWLFNPFGPTTLRLVLRRLCDARRTTADPVFLAYFNPVHESVLAEFPALVPHARGRRWAVYRLDRGSPGQGPPHFDRGERDDVLNE
jgi:SAM-dependent methyltransferase